MPDEKCNAGLDWDFAEVEVRVASNMSGGINGGLASKGSSRFSNTRKL